MFTKKVSIAHAPSKKILVLNLKGGVGKSTFSVNLASKLCLAGFATELIDSDKQGSSHSWANLIEQIPSQHVNLSFKSYSEIASSVKVRKENQFTIIDSPANFLDSHLKKYIALADLIIIPIQPSPVDLHATLPFIEKVITGSAATHKKQQVGFVINRCTDLNPQIQKVQNLLNHFRQFEVLGLMSESYLYQEAFNLKSLVDVDIDQELWQKIFSWLIPEKNQSSTLIQPKQLKHCYPLTQ